MVNGTLIYSLLLKKSSVSFAVGRLLLVKVLPLGHSQMLLLSAFKVFYLFVFLFLIYWHVLLMGISLICLLFCNAMHQNLCFI